MMFTLNNVGDALFASDARPPGVTRDQCRDAAEYLMKTCLGLRAACDGGVEVDLGKAGFLRIVHHQHEKPEPKPRKRPPAKTAAKVKEAKPTAFDVLKDIKK
jgi:hypothetical protein